MKSEPMKTTVSRISITNSMTTFTIDISIHDRGVEAEKQDVIMCLHDRLAQW